MIVCVVCSGQLIRQVVLSIVQVNIGTVGLSFKYNETVILPLSPRTDFCLGPVLGPPDTAI